MKDTKIINGWTFDEYVNEIAKRLRKILPAKITVHKQVSFTKSCRYELYIWIDYENRTYALTPFFFEMQYKNRFSIDDAVHNVFIGLRERDKGILADFQKVR